MYEGQQQQLISSQDYFTEHYTATLVQEAEKLYPGEIFNQTSVRMGDWKGLHEVSDASGVWKLFNLANDPGENTNVADQHPDIVQTMKATYAKFAKDVGVVIPTTGNFANLFPAVTASNTQTINLTKNLVPGYWKGELNPVSPLN